MNAAMPSAGRITVVVSGDLVALPDGDIVDCTFTLAAGATGSTPLTFQSAAMSDDQFNDYDATGTSGAVTVGGGTGGHCPPAGLPAKPRAVAAAMAVRHGVGACTLKPLP